jgi:hypothetical protein
MERQAPPTAEGPAAAGRLGRPLWTLCFLGLLAWQGWMTLGLFGSEAPWQNLLSEAPVVCGRHPLHLYHGYLGAQAFRDHGTLCCYDPLFQAGYPKTPVFDSGSRLAELFLTLAGGNFQPTAYKVGLALCCLSFPLLLWVAARGVGVGRGTTCLALAAGLLVCWSGAGRSALEAGDLDLLTAALAALAQFGLLVQWDRAPGAACWIGILLTGVLAWLANPLLVILLFPLVLLYYLGAGPRHPRLGWHAGLLGGMLGGPAVNWFWLVDWVKNWWVRAPLQIGGSLLPHRTLQTLWNAPFWGDAGDRGLALALVAGAALGVLVLNQCKQRAAARLLGLGVVGLLTLAVLGIAAEPVGRLGTAGLLVPALWFATIPAAHALTQTVCWAGRRWGSPGRVVLLGAALLAGGAAAAGGELLTLAGRATRPPPLAIGLGAERLALVDTLRDVTGTDARILWEERSGSADSERWACLLPVLTGRYFLGGLDPHADIDHSYACLVEGNLAGRPVGQWSDAQLEDYCRRYNVGWVVCWSRAVQSRLAAWNRAEPGAEVADGHGRGWVFTVRRPGSFARKGQAQLVHADCQHITLANVVPEDGKVVLCFHHQAGLRASPSRVQVEPEVDPDDPIPFIRLRVSGPVARVTLSWEKR